MADVLKRATGIATQAGATIFTVPAGTTITLIGCRFSNTDAANEHTVYAQASGSNISGTDVPLPIGAAIDLLIGSKIVMEEGDSLVAFADDDTSVDVYLSFLEQD